jgi:D-aminopeptidase
MIDAVEEAVVNAMLAPPVMTGADGIRILGLPGDRVGGRLREYGRI